MKKICLATFFYVLLSSVHCKRDAASEYYLIEKGKIGFLHKGMTISHLRQFFDQKYIIKRLGEGVFADSAFDSYDIFDKKGNFILSVIPAYQHDTTSVLHYIKIHDPRFKTAKGLSLQSTYKDIKDHYSITKVDQTLNFIILHIDELEAFVSIDKKELQNGWWDALSKTVSLSRIPNTAKIKDFTLQWE